MAHGLACANLSSRRFQNRLEARRVREHQVLELLVDTHRQEHGDRPTIARDDHGPFFTRLEVSAKMGEERTPHNWYKCLPPVQHPML
jgi:hypothetical protein